jgi:glutaredoxin 3
MSAVKIYTTPICGYCVMAKRLLDKRGVAYEEINAAGQTDLRDWLIETTGQRTVPQIFIHDQAIGGFTELNALDRRGELLALIERGPQGEAGGEG